jgi:type II secretory pathway component GspD/PulD (secretin)
MNQQPSSPLSRRRRFAAAALALAAAGCVSSSPQKPPAATLSPQEQAAARPEAPSIQELERRVLATQARGFEDWSVDAGNGQTTRMIPTKKGKAAVLADLIRKHVKPDGIDFIADYDVHVNDRFAATDSTDLLIVTGTEAEIADVGRFLDMMEARAPQIEIEARVVEILSDKDLQIGVNAAFAEAENLSATGAPLDNLETLFNKGLYNLNTQAYTESLTTGAPFQGTLLELGTIHDEIAVNVLIQALSRESYAEILSAPRVTVLNGYTAEITTATQNPYLTARPLGGTTALDVKFKEAGIKLKVTPYVIAEDTVQMIVAPEVSTVTGYTPAVGGSFPNPIISRRNANTVVNVRSGSTYVIGGLLSNNEIEDVSQIPLLGDIPILGALFRSTRLRRQYTQLVFFITPRIIGTAGEGGRILVPTQR